MTGRYSKNLGIWKDIVTSPLTKNAQKLESETTNDLLIS